MNNLLAQAWSAFKRYPLLFTWRCLLTVPFFFIYIPAYFYVVFFDTKLSFDKISPTPWAK